MRVPWCERGAGLAGLDGPAAPLWRRLSLAIAVSVALHASLVFGLHPSGASGRIQFASVIAARLSPLPAAEPLSAPPGELSAAKAAQPPPHDEAAPPRQAEARTGIGAPAEAGNPGWLDIPLPTPRYYLAPELDRSPVPLQPVEPESPAEAGITEGTVVLRVRIDERGGVDDVTVVRAQPQDVFEKSAVAAFSRARFSPGMLYGQPVKSQILVEVQFRNPNRIASGRSY